MSDQATSTPGGAEGANPADLKGKGKAVEPQDMSMDEEDDESDEPGDEEAVEAEIEEEEDEDNMEEISTENILGRRTRGTKDIDYAKAAAEAEDLEDDEDDDDDFQAQEDDAMQE